MTTVGRWRAGRRGRAAAVLAVALLALGVGAAIASPPRSASFEDLDGRTWLATPRVDGSQLLLVNGISGLIEGEETVPGTTAAPSFVASSPTHALFRSGGDLIVVEEASQTSRVLPDTPPTAALVGDRLLTVSDGGVAWLDPDGKTARDEVVGAPRAVADVAPVVDGAGGAWYLGERDGGGRIAVGVDPSGDVEELAVDAATSRLVSVDGRLHAVSPSGTREVGADRPGALPGGDLAPTVADGSRGTWATAAGSVVDFGGAVEPQDLGAAVGTVAIWHGQVVAITEAGAFIGAPGRLEPIEELGPGAALHLDGGLLWVATSETAVAVDRDHDRTVLRLADVDLSLCVGDCSAAAASRFLEDAVTTTTAPPSRTTGPMTPPTTAQPLRKLDADVPPPTLANTSTTVPRPAASTTTTIAVEAVTTTVPSDADLVATTVAPPPPTTAQTPGDRTGPPSDDRPPRRPDPLPLPPPIVAPTTTEAPDDPEPEPEPTPEPQPQPDPVGLEFDVHGGTASADAILRVLASAEDCGATTGSTTATLSWEGSGSGSRELLVLWNGGSPRSERSTATIAAPAGELTVRVSVCGVAAQRTTTVQPLVTTTTTTTTTTAPPSTTTTTRPPSTTTTTRPPSTTTTTRPPSTTTTTTRPPSTTTTTRLPPTTTTTTTTTKSSAGAS